MYSESLDLHAASPLYQCPSLEDLDRYLLVLVYTGVRGHPCVCLFLVWPWAFFGLSLIKNSVPLVWAVSPGVARCTALPGPRIASASAACRVVQ